MFIEYSWSQVEWMSCEIFMYMFSSLSIKKKKKNFILTFSSDENYEMLTGCFLVIHKKFSYFLLKRARGKRNESDEWWTDLIYIIYISYIYCCFVLILQPHLCVHLFKIFKRWFCVSLLVSLNYIFLLFV